MFRIETGIKSSSIAALIMRYLIIVYVHISIIYINSSINFLILLWRNCEMSREADVRSCMCAFRPTTEQAIKSKQRGESFDFAVS